MKKFLPLIIIFCLIISIYPIWLHGEALSFEQARNRNETIHETEAKLEELKILNPHSSPQAGDNWEVSFQTKGTADLTITPDDKASIDDLEFISLKCGDEQRIPQILEGDVVFYPNWFCTKEGKIIHLVKVRWEHFLKFQFGNKIAYAYNSPDNWVSPTGFVDSESAWTNETDLYDDDEDSYAYDQVDATSWTGTLELTHAALNCDKLRYNLTYAWIGEGQKNIDLDVYYSDAWHDVYEDIIGENREWVEKELGGTYSVTALRFRIYNSDAYSDYMYAWEFDFNEVEAEGGYEMASDSYRVWQSSINVGGYGGSQTSTSYHLRETIGEIATGISTSTAYKLFAGYQQMQEVYLALSAPSQVTMSPSIGGLTGGQSNGTATTTVTTDSPSGYSLSVRASSSPAMATSSYSFADYIPATAGTPDYTWSIPATTSEFGFTPEGSDIIQKFLDNGSNTCNTGSSETTDACWNNFSTSDETIAQTYSANHPSGTQTIVKFKAESGTSNIQEPGEYQATITITAIPN